MGNITVLANQISFEDFMSARKITEADIKAIIRDNIRDGLTWDFEWGSGVRRFGCCTTWRSRPGYVRITISRLLANNNDYETVRQVVLHEVAHANVGGGHGHDYVWQREARRLGTSDSRCYNSGEGSTKAKTLPKKFIGTCPRCGYTCRRNRRTDCYHKSCGAIAGAIVWTRNPDFDEIKEQLLAV